MVAVILADEGVAADSDDVTRTTEESVGIPALSQPPARRLAVSLQVRDRDRYEILGEHGRGGLGTVARAHDTELGRHVAIKELLSRSDVGEIRFLREALITARLEHPGIVPVHEAGRWPDGTPFYVMKLVAGRSLKELLADRVSVDTRLELLHHVIAVADAVAYAHKRKIIHRDLKPANVVVGDFGETVVIDWGLAKELASANEPGQHNAPYRTAQVDDLTVAGSVLGTPMYMAPEQWRGEAVDQRADVFAIGAMLWELCSLQRVPPAEPRRRDRMLRRAGIDKDLITILGKALSPTPADRYSDAGELAEDLKAFKAGARIAARRYSLLAMLAHWTRRHRALAATISSAVMLGIVGTVAFVINVASERDRADAARVISVTLQQRAEQANSELVLQNGELLLQRDPTAAVAAVAEYRGTDGGRRQRLVAEAEGRGIARAQFAPHSDTIWFLAGDPSGAVFSLGEDRKIRVTKGTTSSTLADDVSMSVAYDYSSATGRLAYATVPAGIAVIDLRTAATTRIPAPPATTIAIAPDGSRLAALDARGMLRVWSTSPAELTYEVQLTNPVSLRFAGPSRLVVREKSAFRAFSFVDDQPTSVVAQLSPSTFDARSDDVIIGDTSGRITLLSPALTPMASAFVCRDRVNSVHLAERARLVAFACQDGVAGVARYDDVRNIVVDTFSTNGPSSMAVTDASGERVVVVTKSTEVYLYDAATRLVRRYDGQAGYVSIVAPPSAGFDQVLVGDVNGRVRIYDLPPRDARLLIRASKAVYGVAFSPDGETLVTSGSDRIVRRVGVADGSVTALSGHEALVRRVRFAADGTSFLSYSNDGTVRIWNPPSPEAIRVFAEHGGVVGDAEYTNGGRGIASVGDDGRLLLWSPQGDDVAVLFSHGAPLIALEVLEYNQHIVVHDAAGGVWDVRSDGVVRQVRIADGAEIMMLRASQDGRLLGIGTAAGDVTIYETDGYTVQHKTVVPDSVRHISFDPQNRDLVISSEAGHVRLLSLGAGRSVPWSDLRLGARDVAYAPDGDTIAIVRRDGGSWFYAVRDNRWVYTLDHTASVMSGRFSRDGTSFATTDVDGHVVVRHMGNTLRTKRGRK